MEKFLDSCKSTPSRRALFFGREIAGYRDPGLRCAGMSKAVKGKTWSKTGEPIYLALDAYNNTGGGCAIDRDTGTR